MYPGKISRTSGIKYQRAAWLLVTAAPQGVKNSVPAAARFKLRRPLKDLGGVLLTHIIGPHCSAPAVAPFSLRAKGKVSRCGKMSSVTWSPLSCTNTTSVRHPQGPLYFPVPHPGLLAPGPCPGLLFSTVSSPSKPTQNARSLSVCLSSQER